MSRAELDLAIARIAFLTRGERVRLSEELDREAQLSVLSLSDLERIVGRSLRGRSWSPASLLRAAAEDRGRCRSLGIDFVSYREGGYPPLLRELSDPPSVLFYRGTLPDQGRPLVSVVGTRHPGAEASSQAYEFGGDFARSGVPVVSGLALGIDGMAHRGAVDAGGESLAVLGSGLDRVYPASHRDLARRIVERGGALVSEYPPGTPPLRFHFPERNRVIAGLCRALVVVEAPEGSGALISADFALEGGRDLWVGSAGVVSPRGEGTRRLAEEGAPVASRAADVLEDWGQVVSAAPSNRVRLSSPFRVEAVRSLEEELYFGSDPSPTGRRHGGVR